jgi:alpha-glucosidase
MIARLHEMGFVVLLWICPFVSADSPVYRQLSREGGLLRDPLDEREILWAVTNKHPAHVRWWNGASGLLDLSDPKGQAWLRRQLDRLRDEYGVDGFKLDAGDANFYTGNLTAHERDWCPNDHTQAFAELAADYPFSELRACWKLGGRAIAQRLRDKRHNWDDLKLLIPHATLSGLLGYPHNCPDMIGGGEYHSFQSAETMDEELFVRSAQCSALMPMMQFSAAPWRVLSPRNADRCRQAAELHGQFAACILDLAREAARTGAPIVRSMAYQFPDLPGSPMIDDQFMLGPDVMVAPVLEKGQRQRTVVIPAGRWTDDAGLTREGPAEVTVEAPMSRLPYFRRD